jgi:cell division protein FtsZ
MNTDAKSLKTNFTGLIKPFLLHRTKLNGNGSGGDPLVGKKAIQAEKDNIESILAKTDLAIIIAGLGKGTGSGGVSEVLTIAKTLKIPTYTIVTLPSLNIEGKRIYNNARNTLDSIKNITNSITCIDNDRIINNREEHFFNEQFELANNEIKNIVSSIVKIIKDSGRINIDLNDFRNFIQNTSTLFHFQINLDTNNYDKSKLGQIFNQQIKDSKAIFDFKNNKVKAIVNIESPKNLTSKIVLDIKNELVKICENDTIDLLFGTQSADTNSHQVKISIFISNDHKIDTSVINETNVLQFNNDDLTKIKPIVNNSIVDKFHDIFSDKKSPTRKISLTKKANID